MDDTADLETLIDYHFGGLAPEAAAGVEERLLTEAELLRAYLSLKRQLDAGREGPAPSAGSIDLEVPSPAARARLRSAVAAVHGPGPGRSLRRWLRRPVPLYQTVAVAAAVGAVVALFGFRPSAGTGSRAGISELGEPRRPMAPPVDSARTLPASLEVF